MQATPGMNRILHDCSRDISTACHGVAFVPVGGATPVPAQEWPTKTVHIMVPVSPGSTPDIVARLVTDGLQQKYPTSKFVVEDKPGASGDLDTDVVAKATPDGSTLGVSIGGPPAINSLLFARLPYDPHKDIAPIPQRPVIKAANVKIKRPCPSRP